MKFVSTIGKILKGKIVALMYVLVAIGLLGVIAGIVDDQKTNFKEALIKDNKIEYQSDKFGNTKLVLLDSTMVITFKRFK